MKRDWQEETGMNSTVELSITIAAPPDRVWKAWVEEINSWWTKPYYNDHDRVTGLQMEPNVGGRFVEQWGEAGAGFLIGTVVEWLPPVRLAHTWTESGWTGAVTLVRLEFTPDKKGGTTIRFEHSGFDRVPDGAANRQGYQQGWDDLLRKFGRHAAAA